MKASNWKMWGAIILSLVIAAKTWSIWTGDMPEPTTETATIESPQPSRTPTALPGMRATTPAPEEVEVAAALSPEDAKERRRQLIQADPALHDRAQQQSLAKKAEERWARAVDDGGYAASDLDPSIRSFFGDVGLEPRYEKDGLITGLVIQDLQDDHPLALAGFQVGDRLSRIQGVALRYPEELPSLLARLGPNFSVCRAEDESGATEACEEFMLH